MRFHKSLSIVLVIIFSTLFFNTNFKSLDNSLVSLTLHIPFVQAASNLNGRILLQVEDKGQAWYVNPVDSKRYYLGRPKDAFNLMRSLGLGISNSDLASFHNLAPRRLAGRILLQVEDKGQAYYVNPLNLKLDYLGRPKDAFDLMRSSGLGITNVDLALVAKSDKADNVLSDPKSDHVFTFKYQNNEYQIGQNLSLEQYNIYKNSAKVYTYFNDSKPSDLRNSFYALFLQVKPGDDSLDELVSKIKKIAHDNKWSSDQLAEFTLAFVQYIPYDHAKLEANNNRNTNPYYPYETLYLDRGVCSDKTFLAVSLFRRLGFGAAILDFPDINHSALGLACPISDSINKSGYCYAETTNYFPLGVIPQSINAGRVETAFDEFNNLLNPSNLGTIKIYQASQGILYQGIPKLKEEINSLKLLKTSLSDKQKELNDLAKNLSDQTKSISNLKSKMDAYYNSGNISEYNKLVLKYNSLVNKYNDSLANYKLKISEYNEQVNLFNKKNSYFYQK